ncbi:ADP-ribosylglycohydrolase family protein [Demequina rhizosphaerae]|uniref:ADP-ribosylglycohydrolase family protein n=1 Tax=Demequina rhizosphaerae TaxID=1638985 RepID=UPI00078546C8|nr:ADP-ribosylglycohydrolase family protein [Demequina rhizosphaerae]
MTTITSSIAHRAAGAIVGSAVGDAIGAPYEFGPARPHLTLSGTTADMTGSHTWSPGEWTDDTSMAVPILRAAAAGLDLAGAEAQDRIVRDWSAWARGAKDVGVQTSQVFSGMRGDDAVAAAASARRVHEVAGRSGGNGSVMRTAPVGLAYLGEAHGAARVAEAADAIAGLTHFEDDARDGAALWSVLVHLAVRDGRVRLDDALAALPAARRERWGALLATADGADPDLFQHNGWVVHAVQAAYAAIRAGGIVLDDPATHTPAAFRRTIEEAIRIHNDTDTVAAIAGALAGALVGVSAIPVGWQRLLHGHPGLRAGDLTRLAVLAVRGGVPDSRGWLVGDRVDYSGWPERDAFAVHPHDDGVLMGGVHHLAHLPADIDAVVSLCRLGALEVPARIGRADVAEVWLIDDAAPGANEHLGFVLEEAADTVAALRAEGKHVYLHCVAAHSRTPTVAALYAARHLGVEPGRALAEVAAALPAADPNRAFRAYLAEVRS